MKFYFAWSTEAETFDPMRHEIMEEEILSFVMTEKEGQFPSATLEFLYQKKHFFEEQMIKEQRKDWCFISVETKDGLKLLFKGRRYGVPEMIKNEVIRVRFIAQPSRWEEKLQDLHQRLKQSPQWDPLFVEEAAQDDPVENLEGRSALYYWCRVTHDVRLTDLFWGTQRQDLGNQLFHEDLSIRFSEPPLTDVNVTIAADWQQFYDGTTDLAPALNRAFPEGIINTLTGKALEASWWKPQKKLEKTGYYVQESSLEEIAPLQTGMLNPYPDLSSLFWISPEDPAIGELKINQAIQKRLKRTWYSAQLIVEWKFKQPRRERVEFTLKHHLPPQFSQEQRTRRLNFTLENLFSEGELIPWRAGKFYAEKKEIVFQGFFYKCVCDHVSIDTFEADYWQKQGKKPSFIFTPRHGRFFTTDRGLKAIEHALERAKAHLAGSARAIEIKGSGPLEAFLSLTCDHSVRLQEDHLPGGETWGKVKELKFVVDGDSGEQWAEIIVGVSIGDDDRQGSKSLEMATAKLLKEEDSSYSVNYEEENYVGDIVKGTSPSGLTYHLDLRRNKDGEWIYPHTLTSFDIIQKITVENDATQQNNYLSQHQYPESQNIESTLKEVPTRLHLKLKDLSTMATETERLKVVLTTEWSAPAHLKLSNKP